MTTLITGGLGFIGTHLARKLVKMGEYPVLFDIAANTKHLTDIKDRVKIVMGDLSNWALVLDTVKQNEVDNIFHIGALLSASAEASPLAGYMVNAGGTFHILEAARLFKVSSVTFLSSIATYGPGLPERVGDDVVQRPETMYGVTKVFGELMGDYYHRRFGVNFRGLRLPSIIGPGRGIGGASAYSSLVIQEPAAGRRYEVFVEEGTTIPLMYIRDAINSLVILRDAKESSLTRRMYNIQGFSPTAKELAETVRSHIPKADITFKPVEEMVRIADSWPRELDDSNARREWGWKPEYTLNKAVEDFIQEFRSNRAVYE